FERLVTGQIRETVGPVDGQDPLDHYLTVLADKTGSLIATSGRFGAMLSGAGEQTVDVLARFGARTGVACQLAGDLLAVRRRAGGGPGGRAERRGRLGEDPWHRAARGGAAAAGVPRAPRDGPRGCAAARAAPPTVARRRGARGGVGAAGSAPRHGVRSRRGPA